MYEKLKAGTRINKDFQPTSTCRVTDLYILRNSEYGYFFINIENSEMKSIAKKDDQNIYHFHSIEVGRNHKGQVVKYNVRTKELGEIALDTKLNHDPMDGRDSEVHFPSMPAEEHFNKRA